MTAAFDGNDDTVKPVDGTGCGCAAVQPATSRTSATIAVTDVRRMPCRVTLAPGSRREVSAEGPYPTPVTAGRTSRPDRDAHLMITTWLTPIS